MFWGSAMALCPVGPPADNGWWSRRLCALANCARARGPPKSDRVHLRPAAWAAGRAWSLRLTYRRSGLSHIGTGRALHLPGDEHSCFLGPESVHNLDIGGREQ
jgi:hypothetical protein